MPYQAVIWDVDGTLLDTLDDQADSTNAMLASFGFPTLPKDAYRYLIGDGLASLIRNVTPDDIEPTEELHRKMAEGYKEQYGRRWNAKTRPYDGVPEVLDALAERGVKQTVLSNKPDAALQKCVSELLSPWSFDVVFGQRDGFPRKPDPAGIHETLRLIGVEKENALYVGDTGTDMETAKNAGLFAVGVLWGFRERDELESAGADVIIEKPGELLQWF